MLKSIRNGGRPVSSCPASTAPIEGRNSLVELLAERIAAHQPVGFDRDIDDRGQAWSLNCFSGRLK